jgi:uroporphyrinogen-III decarboxylase
VREAIDNLLKAADQTMADVSAFMQAGMEIMSRFGAPPPFGGISFAPFDLIGDTMRGTINIMLDMFRRPDDLLAACEALLPISVGMAVEGAYATRNPFVIMPLHKGAEGFMSTEQFVKFYWPTFLKQILAMIEAGLVPVPFVEGGYTERLDIIAESGIPAGRTAWLFDRTDMKTAKEKLGGFACIGGNVPASLFATGTPEMVEAYCRDLLDVAAEGGGFFLSPGAVMDQAKPENVRTYLNVRRSYT